MSAAFDGRRRADRGVSGVLVRDPRRGDVLRDRGVQPDRRPARTPGDGRRAAAGVRLPGRSARGRLGGDPAPPLVRGAGDRRLSAARHPGRDSRPDAAGAGRLGRLDPPSSLADFAAAVGRTLDSSCVQMVGDPRRPIDRVAVCCGAGDDFLKDAARAGADVLLTGEARFHRGLEAEALGIALIIAGHHATERLGVEDLARRIAAAFPELTVWPSRSERDPFRLVPLPLPPAPERKTPGSSPGQSDSAIGMDRTPDRRPSLVAPATPARQGSPQDFFFGLTASALLGRRLLFFLDGFSRPGLARPGRRQGQVHLVLPCARPELPRPLLQRDRPDRRPILVPDHFAPRTRIRRAHLRGALADAQQPLASRGQTRHRSPVLSTNRSTAHRK